MVHVILNPRVLEKRSFFEEASPFEIEARCIHPRRCVVPIDGDKKAGRGCRFRGRRRRRRIGEGARRRKRDTLSPAKWPRRSWRVSVSFSRGRRPIDPSGLSPAFRLSLPHRRGWWSGGGIYDCYRGVARFESSTIFLPPFFFSIPL